MTGIYKITSPSGKIYIGQSKNIEKRFGYYKRLECRAQPKIYNSFMKYGVNEHKFEIVEECLIENLNFKERYYQELYKTIGEKGLNCILTETEYQKKEDSELTKKNRSESKMGIKNPMYRLKGSLNPLYGRKLNDSHKKNLSKNSGQAKIIICLNTGIYYSSLVEACNVYNLNYGSMMNKMQGYRKNNTSLRYA